MINKLFLYLKKNYLFLLCCFIILIILMIFQYTLEISNKNNIVYDTKQSHLIKKNFTFIPFPKFVDELTQKFVAKENNLSKVNLYVNSSNKTISANIIIGIMNQDEKVICEHKYSVLHFQNTNYINFEFPTIKNSKDKEYTIYIKHLNDEYSDVTFIEDVDLLMNNNSETNANIFINPVYKNSTNNELILTFIIISTVLVFFVIFIIHYKKYKIEKIYLFTIIVFSIFTIILTPLFVGKDENSHWTRAFEIANGHMLSGIKDNWPTSSFSKVILNLSGKNFKENWNMINLTYNEDEMEDYDMEYMSVYSPISYLPQSLGIFISKIFTNHPIIWAYSGRIMNAVFFITMFYLAIKIIPIGKKSLFLIGLLPSTINSFSTLSADGFLLASITLFISYILYLIYNRKKILKRVDYIILMILTIIISLSKLVYLPFLFLLFSLIKKDDSNRKKIMLIVIAFLGLLLNLIWGKIAFQYLKVGQGLNSTYYIIEILKHPVNFIQKFLYTYANNIGKYINDVFGGNNNWYGSSISDASIVPLIAFILYILAIRNNETLNLTKLEKWIFFLVIIAVFSLISVSLYISCTPIGFSYFAGIQGRYFLPILLPIFLFINSNYKRKYTINEKLYLSGIILLSYYSLTILFINYL